MSEERITVHIKYRDVEQTFTGNVNDVWVGVNRFFSQTVPCFNIARKVVLTLDLEKLVEDFKGIITITPEGPDLLIPKEKITDSETLSLYLLAAYLGYRLGHLSEDTLPREDLQTKLGKNPKITSTRLGELCHDGLATKTEDGEYRITAVGVKRLQDEALPKIRAKFQAS